MLKYISNKTKCFYTFVANRVASLREATHVVQWKYISSKNNPADEASRGLTADSFLACRRWISGPDFLQKVELDWPMPLHPHPISSEDPEVKKDRMANIIITDSEGATTKLINYFSCWTELRTSVAWFLKLKTILLGLRRKRNEVISSLTAAGAATQLEKVEMEMRKVRNAVISQSLSVMDIHRAESAVIRFSQQASFKEEISSLEGGSSGVRKTSAIYQLDPG